MDLASTSSCNASSADWLALPATLVTRLVFRAVMLDWLAAMLGGGQVRGQGIGREVRRGRQSGHLGLQSGEARGVGPDGCGVCRGRQGCVRGQHGGQLAGRDAADLRGAPIVQNVSGDGAFEQGHDGVSLSARLRVTT